MPSVCSVVAVHLVSDLSFEEVAQALGLTEGAAKMRALRGRDMLARRLARLVKESSSDG